MKRNKKDNFDEFLLKSIEPDVEKAINKLKKKQALKLQDIMVLLLKSQFNHIEHIDREQTELKKQFIGFKDEITGQFHSFKDEITGQFHSFKEDIIGQFHSFKGDITGQLKTLEINIYKSQSNLIKWMIGTLIGIGILTKILDKIL